MQHSMHIAIVGAGVAGLATALLALQHGHRVILMECQSQVSSMGAGVTLWPNALEVLDQMGVGVEIRQRGGRPQEICVSSDNSELQRGLDVVELGDIDVSAAVSILRRDLMDVLAQALYAQGGAIHFNQAVSPEQVAGLKETYDLVIGADGRMNSAVRQAIYAQPPMPQYQGFINIIGICDGTHESLGQCIYDIRGDGERFGIVPVAEKGYYWAAGWRTSIDKERPLASWYQEMHQRFDHWPAAVQHILASYDADSLKRIFVHDLDPLPYWHRDNVLIIGDAAHAPLPTSGQGACLALEDAWHLIQLLSQHQDLQAALQALYALRVDTTTAVQSLGRHIAADIFKTR